MISSLVSAVLMLGTANAVPSPSPTASASASASAAPAPTAGIIPAQKPTGDYAGSSFRFVPSQLKVAGTSLCFTSTNQTYGSQIELAECSKPRENIMQLWGLTDAQNQFFLAGSEGTCLSQNYPQPDNLKLGVCDADDSDIWFVATTGELCTERVGCVSVNGTSDVKAGDKLTVADDPSKFVKIAYQQDIELTFELSREKEEWCPESGPCLTAATPTTRATDAPETDGGDEE
ncbi:hypothetical protein A1Q1_03311 [Trichosporon asahii var. asahii CBS 2479]|uniref:Ricin B lectin domain-containing protein n=1 Tax=Trichosporon asahii var. asahii (strain ATCC 90039 / CBS 2479 / JCM 2466 / KCTC 7840 / NBRC 103889/ NCYC 2677 / UAMH 7654) TaxID=1186058 RepID=J4UAP1_TRIAS|nr:hypothetical protein A1Q1_03311 [Trichosporon asahii var. asahii CBS 2479]EJT47850.1 hypothetical protein A1Q1_03311 [Trichosporon asahii var. asahii CBS 2479]